MATRLKTLPKHAQAMLVGRASHAEIVKCELAEFFQAPSAAAFLKVQRAMEQYQNAFERYESGDWKVSG